MRAGTINREVERRNIKPIINVYTPERTGIGTGNDGSVLYLTSDMYLCRTQTLTKGDGFD